MNAPKRVLCDGCRVAAGQKHYCYTAMSVVDGVRTNLPCECKICKSYESVSHPAALMENAFNQVGHSMMKEEFAAKLLAFTYVFGSELCVLHVGMHAGIMIAQEKANIKGGHVPDRRIVHMINVYIRELNAAEVAIPTLADRESELVKRVPWLQEIYDRYDLTGISSVRKPKKEKADATADNTD